MPREFSQAWLHLISLFVTFIDRDFTEDDHLEKIEALINDGMAIIIRGFPKQNLTDNVAVPPMEILSLISMQLFKDRVGKADDILQTYSQYLGSLVSWQFNEFVDITKRIRTLILLFNHPQDPINT